MQLDKVPHKKIVAPHRYIKGMVDVYYISRYPEGDAHIHVSHTRDRDGYAGATRQFLLEDGSIEAVIGPYCCDGMFDHGVSQFLAELLDDNTLMDKAYRLTVGVNLRHYATEVIYQETGFILGDPDKRIKKEWEGLEVNVEGRGFVSYKRVKDGKITCPCCGAKKPVSPNLARDKSIRKDYTEGISLAQLSAKHLVTEQRIRQIIGCDNLRGEDKHISLRLYESRQERNQEIYRLYKHGHSKKFICEKFDLSRSTVWQVIKKMATKPED